MKFSLLNPKINDKTMSTKYVASTPLDAAKKAWEEMAKVGKLKSLRNEFYFSLIDDSNKVSSFSVKEKPVKSKKSKNMKSKKTKEFEFEITPVATKKNVGKQSKELMSRMLKNLKGGAKDSDSDSSDSDSDSDSGSDSDSDSESDSSVGLYVGKTLKGKEKPALWLYDATYYDVDHVWIPRGQSFPQFVFVKS